MENDDLIVLKNDNGEEIEFIEIAGIALDGKFYVILQPVELLYDMTEDEALVFEVDDDGENQKFSVVLDDEIIDKVFNEYFRLIDLDKAE